VAEQDGRSGRRREHVEVRRLEASIDDLQERLARANADYQNLEKRVIRERYQTTLFANEGLLKELLFILDDFERSFQAPGDHEGNRLIYDNLLAVLAKHGVQRIEALHQSFDPNRHEAVALTKTGHCLPGTVIADTARGYMLHGNLLRPSKVIVSEESDD